MGVPGADGGLHCRRGDVSIDSGNLWLTHRFTVILVTHDLREAVYLADTVHVVSKRPGRIVESRKVDRPRPRTLEDTFEPAFVEIVHGLRDSISVVRAA